MRRNPALLSVMLSAVGLFVASSANAERTRYRSAHPIPDEVVGQFCYIDLEHTHTYTPDENARPQFVQHIEAGQAQFEFIGDPSQWGYEGPLIGYTDAHPHQFAGGTLNGNELCNLEGSHFHLHGPRDTSQFEERDGTYYFGSFKTVMDARRAEIAARKADEREERRQARSKHRSRSKTRSYRSSSSTRTSASSTPVTKAPVKKPPVKKTSKPAKKGFRSWMSRRRGN